MSDTILGALIGVGILVILNIIAVAFSYGRITARVDKLEKTLSNGFTCKQHANIEHELGLLEGQSNRRDVQGDRNDSQANRVEKQLDRLEHIKK